MADKLTATFNRQVHSKIRRNVSSVAHKRKSENLRLASYLVNVYFEREKILEFDAQESFKQDRCYFKKFLNLLLKSELFT